MFDNRNLQVITRAENSSKGNGIDKEQLKIAKELEKTYSQLTGFTDYIYNKLMAQEK